MLCFNTVLPIYHQKISYRDFEAVNDLQDVFNMYWASGIFVLISGRWHNVRSDYIKMTENKWHAYIF